MVKIEHKKPEIKTEDFARLVFDAIYEERFLSKEQIVPKIRTLAKMYRLKLQADNYHAIENPSRTAALMRNNQKHNFERGLLIEALKPHISDEGLQELFKKIEKSSLEAGFK